MWRCRMNACVRLVLFTSMALCLLACTNPGGTASDVIAGSRSGSYGPEFAAQWKQGPALATGTLKGRSRITIAR